MWRDGWRGVRWACPGGAGSRFGNDELDFCQFHTEHTRRVQIRQERVNTYLALKNKALNHVTCNEQCIRLCNVDTNA